MSQTSICADRRNAAGIGTVLVMLVVLAAAEAVWALSQDIEPGRYRVGEVRIAGIRTITEAAILARVRSRTGELFDPAVAAEDVKRIAEVKGVQYAYYSAELKDDKVELTYVVTEKLLVRGIAFKGNRKYGESTLEKKLHFRRGDYLDKLAVESGLTDMLDFYREKGYAFAEIQLDRNELETGRVVYNITEGPRVKVAKVQFVGNSALKSGNLKDVVKTSTRTLLIFQGYYKEKEAQEDISRLQEAYLKRGFLDVKVTLRTEFTESRDKVKVAFVIEEGPVYRVRDFAIKGNEFFSQDELTAETRLRSGQIYTPEKAEFDRKKILNKFLSAGFINARVEHSRSFARPGQVDAVFKVTQGERFRIGKINITGNDQTQDKVVRRVLDERDFSPGQWYDAEKAEGTGQGSLEKAVKAIAMMQSVTITPSGDKPGVRDAQVSVVEGQTGLIMLGAGVSSDAGVVGQVVFQQSNFDISAWPSSFGDFVSGKAFKGGGQVFRVSFEPGTEYQQFNVSLTEPYLNDKPVTMTVGASRYARGYESFDQVMTTGYVDFERRFKSGWRAGAGFRAERVRIDADDDAPREIADWDGSHSLYGIRPHIGYDCTDEPLNPTRGFYFNAGLEQVFGSASFQTVDGVFRWYKTVGEDFFERKSVLATKVRAGLTSSDAPPFEKFYAGGTGSMRGFEYRGVSKRAGADEVPVGSDWIFLANSELAVPLNSDYFSALFFVDSGTVQTGRYRVSVGAGIQIQVPQMLGPVPMRFEFAVPLRKDDQDETRVFSFSISRLF